MMWWYVILLGVFFLIFKVNVKKPKKPIEEQSPWEGMFEPEKNKDTSWSTPERSIPPKPIQVWEPEETEQAQEMEAMSLEHISDEPEGYATPGSLEGYSPLVSSLALMNIEEESPVKHPVHATPSKEESKGWQIDEIDPKKMILYSELLKPRYLEY